MFFIGLRSLQYWERRKNTSRTFFRYPLLTVLESLFLSAWVSVLVSQWVTIHSFPDTLLWMWEHPVPVLLDCFVLGAGSAILWAAFRRMWLAFGVPALFVYLFSVINYYKTLINSTPLLYSDLAHTGSFFPIAKFVLPQLEFDLLLFQAALLLVLTGWILFEMDHKVPPMRWSRMGFAGVGVAFFLIFNGTDLFQVPAAAVAAEYEPQEERIAHCGSLWAFYCAYAASERGEIEYSTEDMRNRIQYLNTINELEQQEKTSEEIRPHVIFIMSESFFDVTRLPNVQFFKDPLPNYHALAREYTNGPFLSNTCNGGTAYVELEVLTGLCSHLLNEGDTLPSLQPNDVYDRIPSITRVFKEKGYALAFLHAYTPELYNRPEIYKRLGFDPILFSDHFPADAEIKGGYLSDKAFADQLISLYEERDPDTPLMVMGVTMENHQPSYKGKFSPDADLPFQAPTMDEKGREIFQSYLTGVHDADASLGQLVDYFSQVEEPVMLVFWGDHLPNLMVNSTETIYSQLGVYPSPASITWSTDVLKQMLTTDYLIWTNYEEEPEPDHTESCTLLGLSVLKRIGFPLTDYYAWLDANIAPNLLLYRPRLYVDAQGEAYSEVPEDKETMIENYALLMYDIIYGKNEVFAESAVP